MQPFPVWYRLVAVAIVQAQAANTAPGKIASLWMPITTFVALGLEHRCDRGQTIGRVLVFDI